MRFNRTTRLLLPLVLVLTAPVAGSTAAGADSVKDAQRAVSDLRGEVERAAAQLEAASARLRAGEAKLAGVRRKAAVARREAQAAERRADAARAQLGGVVRASYRSPVPSELVVALASGPEGFREAMLARADLDHVRGGQQQLLREATRERVRADVLVRKAAQLEADARKRAQALQRDHAEVSRLAAEIERRLVAANGTLTKAQAARRAALARAARARSAGGFAALCNGEGGGGRYANGFLPPEALCRINAAGNHRLVKDAADAFNRMTAAAPTRLCVSDSYRSYSEQASVYRRKPHLAAPPGSSNHGWGRAVDLCGGVERFGSSMYNWMKANAPRYGWVHPDWAEPGGSRPEAWHWEYVG